MFDGGEVESGRDEAEEETSSRIMEACRHLDEFYSEVH